MTVKQYLRQAYKMDVRLRALEEKRDRLNHLKCSLPAADYSKPRVSGTKGNRTEDIIGQIDEYERMITDRIGDLISLETDIRIRIEMLEDPAQQTVLEQRYLNYYSWEQIAVNMHYNYRWVLQIHSNALKALSVE